MHEAEEIVRAMLRVGSIPEHYGSHILWEMATKHPEMTVLKIHTTGYGDRMVMKWSGDPYWLYEIELRPVKRSELEGEESAYMERKGR